MICLDTNVVIACLKGKPSHLVERVERDMERTSFALSVVTLFELRYGIEKSARHRENSERLAVFMRLPIAVWAFEPLDAEEAGEIRAKLSREGTPIGPYDILIAAQARRRSAILVTANTREFARVSGLRAEDWAQR